MSLPVLYAQNATRAVARAVHRAATPPARRLPGGTAYGPDKPPATAPVWFVAKIEAGLVARGWASGDPLHVLAGDIADTIADMAAAGTDIQAAITTPNRRALEVSR